MNFDASWITAKRFVKLKLKIDLEIYPYRFLFTNKGSLHHTFKPMMI